jgi:altronate dehydratase
MSRLTSCVLAWASGFGVAGGFALLTTPRYDVVSGATLIAAGWAAGLFAIVVAAGDRFR